MTIQTTQASEATQAVASLAEAAVAASHEMQTGATVTMALNRYTWEMIVKLGFEGAIGNTVLKQHLAQSQTRARVPGVSLTALTCACSPVYHKQVTAPAAQKYSAVGTIGSCSIPTTIKLRRCFLLFASRGLYYRIKSAVGLMGAVRASSNVTKKF